jgi:hypothetical protein
MIKKAFPVLLVLFLGFWLFTDPHGFAHATKSSASVTWGLSSQLFTSLIAYFHAL